MVPASWLCTFYALSQWNPIKWVLHEVLQLRKIKQFVSGHGARKWYSHVATGESGVPSCEFLISLIKSLRNGLERKLKNNFISV